MLPSMYIAQYS